MKFIHLDIVLCFLLIFSACSPQTIPTPTTIPLPTDRPSARTTPEITLTPTLTSAPTLTPTPKPIIVKPGEIYYLWGFNQFSSPYIIWGAQLRNTMKGSCQGFICDEIDLRQYDPSVWNFLGFGEYGTKTFNFDIDNNGQIDKDEIFDTFVINFKSKMGFDALSGTTPDGKTVAYGYLSDGTLTTSYMDTSNFSMETIGHAEDTFTAVSEPCGMIDPNPEGDNSFNMSEGDGGIVFNFLDRAWGQRPYATRKGYALIDITIVSAPSSAITPEMICP